MENSDSVLPKNDCVVFYTKAYGTSKELSSNEQEFLMLNHWIDIFSKLPWGANERAFEVACTLEKKNDELKTANSRLGRHIKDRIRSLEAKITPANKRKAIVRRRPIVKACLTHIRLHGAPPNMTDFIKELRKGKLLTKTNAFGKTSDVSDTGARDILRDIFGLKGVRGRKSKRKKIK